MASYQTAPYTHLNELIDTLTKHTQSIETQVKNLSDNARIIGTSSDTREARAKLDEDERRLHELALKTKDILKELTHEMSRRKKELSRTEADTFNRVKAAMVTALAKYEEVVKNVSKKRQQYQTHKNDTLIDLGDENNAHDEIQRHLQLQQQMRMQNNLIEKENEADFMIEEQVNQVQTDVVEINLLMRDVAALVSEQSPIITQIEVNVNRANDHIVGGNQQLDGASRYQKKYRKKLCWLLLIFLIIAVIVAVVIVIKLKT